MTLREFIASLKWGDITSKALILALPLAFSWQGQKRQEVTNADLVGRVDSLVSVVDSLRRVPKPTAYDARQDRRFAAARKKGVRFAAMDTVEVSVKKPGRIKAAWSWITSPFRVPRKAAADSTGG